MPTAFAFNTAQQHAERQRANMEAHGYYAETFPFNATSNNTISITGTVYLQAIGLAGGDVVTNILMALGGTAGSGFSGIGAKVGIYNKAGTSLLASSGDVSGQLAASGTRTMPLALVAGQPFVVPSTDTYLLAFLGIATTMPTFAKGMVGATNANSANSITYTGAQASQTDLPASLTISAAGTLAYWMAVS